MPILRDIKVLDLSRVLAVPFATQLMADFGATIWKVEAPDGDDTRSWGDNYFGALNRGKKSIAVNLKTPQGQQIVHALAMQADVIVENFKVDDLRRYGLDYSTLSAKRPELVYLSLTGFGQTGPRRAQLGYDTIMQGMTGIMSLTGEPDGSPTKVGVAWVDVLAGLTATIGILLAVRERDRSGLGQYVDLSLFDVGIASLIDAGQTYLNGGGVPARNGSVHRSFAPSQPFECKDGWIMVAVGKDQQFQRLCHAIERPDLAAVDRFHRNAGRLAHRDELVNELTKAFRRRTKKDWEAICESAKVPVSPINNVDEALLDPQSLARKVVWSSGPADRPQRILANPLQHMSLTPPQAQGPVPRLGEHATEILSGVLGFDDATIQALFAAGAVGASARSASLD